ncbi:DUF2071 domain-containing protein [Sphingobacterium corticibacter]|uniref:DUF2071 domain-containing protein n=1 Tax=Sphingobacterium corticibacter TaxID=2171749 RepID=A0A2T8HNB3_9SPHI|nr:DUF2071 domain-containing protein [Sphingobacterium corticibacter]PVH26905.1 hypothetical protein DC487_04735 [Sphingobacterium corticibacter]
MLDRLKNHPFAVKAHFDESLVVTFAVPKEQLQHLIPDSLELDTYQDKWAFIAVAAVQTSHLRPAIFPTWLGHDFFLIGYRVFARYTNLAGKRLRGLYILSSETDKRKMSFLGNIFTHYHYKHIDVRRSRTGTTQTIQSLQADFSVSWKTESEPQTIPVGSPFDNWKDARKFAGPLPHTFSYDATKKSMLIVKGLRQDWTPQPIEVTASKIGFIDHLKLDNVVLASAFRITNVPYKWNKGIVEKW